MEQNGFADNIFGEEVAYEAPLPEEKKEFLPWHRPRKQFVRHYQWCKEIRRMISHTPPADGVLKYLGLPGVDLLDLRYFHEEVCQTDASRKPNRTCAGSALYRRHCSNRKGM